MTRATIFQHLANGFIFALLFLATGFVARFLHYRYGERRPTRAALVAAADNDVRVLPVNYYVGWVALLLLAQLILDGGR